MYEDPILRKILDLMNTEGPKALRGRWSIGDSLAIPKNILPHGFIAYDSENVFDIAGGTLRDNANVVISVAVDMTRELQVPTDRSDAHEMIVEFMAKKDKNTLEFDKNSIIGALRSHQELDMAHNLWIEVGTQSSVEYGVGLEKRGAGIVTAEGVLRFQISHDQLIPGQNVL